MSILNPQDLNTANEICSKSSSFTGQTDIKPDQSEICLEKIKGNPYIAIAHIDGAQIVTQEPTSKLPWPFKKFKHVIMATYASYICFLVPGAVANMYAWKAKQLKEKGAEREAMSMVRRAVCWIVIGFILGVLVIFGVSIRLIVCAVIVCDPNDSNELRPFTHRRLRT